MCRVLYSRRSYVCNACLLPVDSLQLDLARRRRLAWAAASLPIPVCPGFNSELMARCLWSCSNCLAAALMCWFLPFWSPWETHLGGSDPISMHKLVHNCLETLHLRFRLCLPEFFSPDFSPHLICINEQTEARLGLDETSGILLPALTLTYDMSEQEASK